MPSILLWPNIIYITYIISEAMINLFRKIRQNLLKENKLNIYLIYAVGEVVLVVFGIQDQTHVFRKMVFIEFAW